MNFSQHNKALKKAHFLKAIGYKFIDESLFLQNRSVNFDSLEQLNLQISRCQLCALRKSAKCALSGSGDPKSAVMFITFAPNASEDESKTRLSGASGAKLKNMIFNALNLSENEFYISSILRCKNSPNLQNSSCFELCLPYLMDEISLISPRIIIALGKEVFEILCPNNLNFQSVRGGIIKFNKSLLMPTFSPEWLMKNPSFDEIFLDDLKKLKEII